MGPWAHQSMGPGVHESVGLWAHGPWAHGPCPTGALYMCPWALGAWALYMGVFQAYYSLVWPYYCVVFFINLCPTSSSWVLEVQSWKLR